LPAVPVRELAGIEGGVVGGVAGGVAGGVMPAASTAAPATTPPAQPVRVGGDIEEPRLVHRVIRRSSSARARKAWQWRYAAPAQRHGAPVHSDDHGELQFVADEFFVDTVHFACYT
jgi:hypothetical protein